MEGRETARGELDDIGLYVGTRLCGSTKIKQLLHLKGREVHTIAPTATVLEALKGMARHEIGALVVLKGSSLTGIISERDYARKVKDNVVGLISIGDLVKSVMSEQEERIEQFERYIRGAYPT